MKEGNLTHRGALQVVKKIEAVSKLKGKGVTFLYTQAIAPLETEFLLMME